jgi:pyridoxamine 5'-phosphate oxidase family protein
MFDDTELAYIQSQRLARLATVDDAGQPDNSPVAFDFDGEHFWIGGFNVTTTRKYKNVVAGHTKVALVIDDLQSVEPWRPRGVRVHGQAEAVERDGQFGGGVYLRVRPVISWSWSLERPFGAGEGPSTKRTVWA